LWPPSLTTNFSIPKYTYASNHVVQHFNRRTLNASAAEHLNAS
jgi:hypothetical protein